MFDLTDLEIDKINEETARQTDEDYKNFTDALRNKKCGLCNRSLNFFKKSEVCLHWLLRPQGVTKKEIDQVLETFEYMRVEAYLRWMANFESPLKNINDLKEQGKSDKIIEITIRYKNLEWSISCSMTDYEGHKNTFEGAKPHYHLQMMIDGKIFFKFSNKHVNFFESDLIAIRVKSGEFPNAVFHSTYGTGIQEAMDRIDPYDMLNLLSRTDDEAKAPFNTQSLLIAEEGKTFSGDDILKIFEESKKRNIPFAKLVDQIPNLDKENSKIFITAGEGVVAKSTRTPRNRGRKKPK